MTAASPVNTAMQNTKETCLHQKMKFSITKVNYREFCDLVDKELKISVLRKVKELQNTHTHNSTKSEK